MRRDLVSAGRYCVPLAACILVGACAGNGETPSLPQLIASAARSLAGLPPDHPDHYAEPVRVSDSHVFTAACVGPRAAAQVTGGDGRGETEPGGPDRRVIRPEA